MTAAVGELAALREPVLTGWAPIRPRPKGSLKPVTRGGRTYLVEDNKRSKPTMDALVLALNTTRARHPRRGDFPLDCPIEVQLALFYVPPANAGPLDRPSTVRTADADKATRLVFDALKKARVIRDDARVVDLNVSAWYDRVDGIRVTVGPARGNDGARLPGPWRR